MEKPTKNPKYKIGDCVICKLWFFYNLVEILGAWWNGERWRYTVKDKTGFVRHCKGEDKLINPQH